MHPNANKVCDYLWIASFCGLALFIPFSIAGANISIMFGFVASLIGVFFVPAVRRRYRGIVRDPMFLACVLLVVSAVPSVAISEDLRRALGELRAYWLFLIYFLVAYNLVWEKLRHVVFWILFGSMVASSLVAFIQYSGGIDLLFVRIAETTRRPSSTLFMMTFAGILYQLIALNSAMLLRHRLASRRAIGLGIGIAAQVAALFLTLTRGAWLAVVGGLFAVPILLKRRVLLFVTLTLFLAAGTIAIQNEQIRDRATSLVKNPRDSQDSNILTRLVLWDISWQVFKSHPFFGTGLGDYTIEAEQLLDDRSVTTTVDSHNIYLQTLATRGLFGFIFFVLFWVILFRVLFDCKRHAEKIGHAFGRHFAAGTIAATVAVLIGAVTENNIDDSEVFICFMFLVGVTRSARLFAPQPNLPAGPQQNR